MKKLEYVKINWNSTKSIKQAERKKENLENSGYKLQNTQSSPNSATLIFVKEKTLHNRKNPQTF